MENGNLNIEVSRFVNMFHAIEDAETINIVKELFTQINDIDLPDEMLECLRIKAVREMRFWEATR